MGGLRFCSALRFLSAIISTLFYPGIDGVNVVSIQYIRLTYPLIFHICTVHTVAYKVIPKIPSFLSCNECSSVGSLPYHELLTTILKTRGL